MFSHKMSRDGAILLSLSFRANNTLNITRKGLYFPFTQIFYFFNFFINGRTRKKMLHGQSRKRLLHGQKKNVSKMDHHQSYYFDCRYRDRIGYRYASQQRSQRIWEWWIWNAGQRYRHSERWYDEKQFTTKESWKSGYRRSSSSQNSDDTNRSIAG